jgi:hypothetical protein
MLRVTNAAVSWAGSATGTGAGTGGVTGCAAAAAGFGPTSSIVHVSTARAANHADSTSAIAAIAGVLAAWSRRAAIVVMPVT